ncbi:hypothetical protein [Lysinibacillus sp. NPDC059133]|uniref:hypothetical protein n=1 Tax=Lysinibacillus sp. NPDC059133 TaxID=3346737 RepID=UPI0036B0DA0E
MAEIFKFFNSAPGDERWHYASDFADFFANVLSSGLLHKDGTPNLQVKVNAGTMQTYVEAGEALIQGYQYQNTTPLFLTHGLPEPNLDRIDRIVLRLDKRNNARYIRLFVKEGVSATNPAPPTLQRDQYVFELSLAQIRLTKNTSTLEPLKLIDERMNQDVCGIVYSLISVPTSVFQQQWDYWFNNKKQTLENDMEAWQALQKQDFDIWESQEKADFDAWKSTQKQEFLIWFESIKDILEGDVAANLATRILALEQTVGTHIADDVSHIKWIETVGGTANALTATIDGLTSYKNGLGVSFPVKSNSTAAMSLNINGLGAIPIKKANGTAFNNGKAKGVYTVRYRDGAFILQGESEVEVGKQIITPSTVNQAITAGVHDGTGYVVGSPNLIPANIKKGVNIFGVTGDASTYPAPSHGTTVVAGVYDLSQTSRTTWDFAKSIYPNFYGDVTLVFDLAKYSGGLNDKVYAYVTKNGATIGQGNYSTNSSSSTVFTINTTVLGTDIIRLYISCGSSSNGMYVNNSMFLLCFGGTPPLGVFEKNF